MPGEGRAVRLASRVAQAIVEHREKDPFDSLRELDAGVGTGTIVFSPAPAETNHLVRIAEKIDQATKRVDIAIYSFFDGKISDVRAPPPAE